MSCDLGGGGWLAVMTVASAVSTGYWSDGAWPLCGRHHALRVVLRHEMRPVLAAEVDLCRANART
eukprot:6553212-Prymnesium_polylepis.1